MRSAKGIRIITKKGQSYVVSKMVVIAPIVIICLLSLALVSLTKLYRTEKTKIDSYMTLIEEKQTELSVQVDKYNKLALEVEELETVISEAETSLNVLKAQKEEEK